MDLIAELYQFKNLCGVHVRENQRSPKKTCFPISGDHMTFIISDSHSNFLGKIAKHCNSLTSHLWELNVDYRNNSDWFLELPQY